MTSAELPGSTARSTGLARFAGPSLLALVLVLGATNVATVLSASFHDLVFEIVQRALQVAGAGVAEDVTRKSLKRIAEARTVKATATLTDENRALKSRNQALSTLKADIDARHAKALAEVATLKDQGAKAGEEIERLTAGHAKAQAELGRIKGVRAAESTSAKEMATSVRARIGKGIARSYAAIPAEAVPYIGIGVTLSVAALDLHDACQTMKEINELMKLLGQGEENADFCGMKTPTVPEVLSRMKTEWKGSVERVAKEARAVSVKVTAPEARLPSAAEARSVICPVVSRVHWIAC